MLINNKEKKNQYKSAAHSYARKFDHVSKVSIARSPVQPALGHQNQAAKIYTASFIGGEITMLHCASFRKTNKPKPNKHLKCIFVKQSLKNKQTHTL